MADPIAALTDREKQTLRLLLDGHDAKSIARECGLSVHTINEWLRDARRKLSVSSSREAARLLRAHEAANPQSDGDGDFGAAATKAAADTGPRPGISGPTRRRAAWAIGGSIVIVLAALVALTTPVSTPQSDTPAIEANHRTGASDAALRFLALVDAGRWDDSWAMTGRSFQAVNTAAAWRAASLKVRAPLGAPVSRQWLSEVDTPSPPDGVTVVRFRTDFGGAGWRPKHCRWSGTAAPGRSSASISNRGGGGAPIAVWVVNVLTTRSPAGRAATLERRRWPARFGSVMRILPALTLAPALLLAACGQPSATAPAASATPDPNGYAAKVAALSAPLRAGVMLRAIRDAGQQCQQVTEAKAAPGASPPAWIATCTDGKQWVVGIADDGTASVTAGADIARRGGS